jgi:predicted nucleic acid-binding protein
MTATELGLHPAPGTGLLVDTNLLVLLTVGMVSRARIERFKRTSKYTGFDYDLLTRVLNHFNPLYTVAHVLAEVSNLTDLSGAERLIARGVLKKTMSLLDEVEIASVRASEDPLYQSLGLADAAIAAVARVRNCWVLTDDLDLYLRLNQQQVRSLNFTHLMASARGL